MSATNPEDADRWHRRFAAELFNATWDLLDKTDRTADDDARMLASAFASRYHWGVVGDARNHAMGDWQIARVCSVLGLPELALRYAQRSLDITQQNAWFDFMLASSYEGMARAHACAGDAAKREYYLELARDACATLDDPEDRANIESQIANVPPAAVR